MKGHHDQSKLNVQTPPQEVHPQHSETDAVLDNSVENLDEIEARSGPSAKGRLSMHSSEGADSEGGDSLDSLSLQDFQGSASQEQKEEGAAAEKKEEITTRDLMVALLSIQNKLETTMDSFSRSVGETMDRAAEKMGEKLNRAAEK